MEILSLLFLVAYGILILWGLSAAMWPYRPSGLAVQFPRMAGKLGISVSDMEDSEYGMHLQTADRLCGLCEDKAACEDWLASHDAATEPPEFCANAGYFRLARA